MPVHLLGRTLIVLGLVLVVAGALFMLFGKVGWPRLPGDVTWSGRGWRISLPLASSILVSLLLTLILNLLARLFR